jgi:ABC-type sugar transport system ATPase subunit
MMVGRKLDDYFHKRRVEPGPKVLEVKGLVVDGAASPVSFSVRAGEIVGVAGLVGAGRSELLETLAGRRRPKEGVVLVAGDELSTGSSIAALRAGVALVPEDRHRQGLSLDATIRENVSMGSWRLWSASRRGEVRTANEVVRTLGVKAPSVEVPVRRLSGGNQQKVVLGRCIARKPRLLLLDEPTRGIDVGAKADVFQIIGGMLAQGVAVLMASSELMELLGVCDRILVLHDQRIVGDLDRAEATEERLAFLSSGGCPTVTA